MSNLPPPPGMPPAPAPGQAWSTLPPNAGWGGPAVPAPQPAAKPTTRLGDGILVGAAAAAIGGALWWAVVAFTERQFFYGAIVVGLLVGRGFLIGARRSGPVLGVLAAIFTLIALVIAEYFIQRSLAISEFGVDVALWTDFSFAKDVVREAVDGEPLTGVCWGLAAISALLSAGLPNRTPHI